MTKTTTWLLAGAALALCAGGAVAAISPQDAARQAIEDSRAAAADAQDAIEDSREAAREARERAMEASRDARERAMEAAERAREAGERAREAGQRAREAARGYGRHGDMVYISRGLDREDYLEDVLQLRPDQTPALDAFLEATRNTGRHEAMVRFDQAGQSGRTTLQRLDEMQSRMAAQQAEANRKIAAIKTFYGQLDTKQKQAFDGMPMILMVGPSVGPMIVPARMPIAHIPPVPPTPPVPPVPPVPPGSL